MSKEMNSQYYLQPKIITNNMDFKKKIGMVEIKKALLLTL